MKYSYICNSIYWLLSKVAYNLCDNKVNDNKDIANLNPIRQARLLL